LRAGAVCTTRRPCLSSHLHSTSSSTTHLTRETAIEKFVSSSWSVSAAAVLLLLHSTSTHQTSARLLSPRHRALFCGRRNDSSVLKQKKLFSSLGFDRALFTFDQNSRPTAVHSPSTLSSSTSSSGLAA
jgi:hypothetical protein